MKMLREERGSATVVGAMVISGLVAVVLLIVYVGAAISARHHSQATADLAALAAAQRVVMGESEPCGAAREIASRMSASVKQCRVLGGDVVVTAQVTVEIGAFGVRTSRSTARAGPSDAG
ncbi:Rv3654c family TadE-like protein [Williamsia sp.]|uniref:Rv3654c family TadE-like protein n=1 Tax=Williamsia sp. TaxID=1872085 RepID=UPI002F95FA29